MFIYNINGDEITSKVTQTSDSTTSSDINIKVFRTFKTQDDPYQPYEQDIGSIYIDPAQPIGFQPYD
jgi:hypothetical protein